MPENDSKANDPLNGLLGALLGGQGGASSSDNPLGNILGSLMGGAPAAGDAAGAGGDPLSALLGGLMGGGAPLGAPTPDQPQGQDAMSAALGGLFGGGAPSDASAGGLPVNSFLAPIVEAISAKLNIPPQIAGAVVSFALTQLMSGQRDPQLAQMLAGKGTISQKYLRDSGLANQLAQQTGMDSKTAVKSLQQVLQAFGTQMGEGTQEDRAVGLQDWLDAR